MLGFHALSYSLHYSRRSITASQDRESFDQFRRFQMSKKQKKTKTTVMVKRKRLLNMCMGLTTWRVEFRLYSVVNISKNHIQRYLESDDYRSLICG